MALVTRKQNEKANRRFNRLRKRKHLMDAINEQVTDYNIVGVGEFKANAMYQVSWMVDGKAVGHNIIVIPEDECKDTTPTEWFHTFVRTVMFGFDIKHADLIVGEVKNDVLPVQKM